MRKQHSTVVVGGVGVSDHVCAGVRCDASYRFGGVAEMG